MEKFARQGKVPDVGLKRQPPHDSPRHRVQRNALQALARIVPFAALLLGLVPPCFADAGAVAVTVEGERVVPVGSVGDVRLLPEPPVGAVAAPFARPFVRPKLEPPRLPKTGGLPAPLAPVLPPGVSAPMPGTIQNFAGMSFSDACAGGQCGGGWPPDTNGEVGPNHFIQAVNVGYAIYNKTGTKLASFTENQLWSGVGSSACNGHAQGDPIVVYDPLADRWILTHFAWSSTSGPFYQCIAASKTSDPVAGGWWLYALRIDTGAAGQPPIGLLNDYPKFGLWHDCLYMGANEFDLSLPPPNQYQGVAFASLSRTDLYNGGPLTWSLGFLPYPANNVFGMFPAHSAGRGYSAVQPGTPAWFVSESQSAFAFEVRKFTPGPNCGGGGTMSAPTSVNQGSYSLSGYGSVVPQPNTAALLDNLADRIMQKVQYRKVGAAESLWVVHTVPLASGQSAVQWAQLDVTGGTAAVASVQQQIYSPDATLYRFMPSLAVDNAGNMAVGYSTSGASAPNYPSIAYSGRLVGDPLGTLPQTEVTMTAGLGSQRNNCGTGGGFCDRWGDYTAMSVDPVDDCTLWYTNQYYSSQANGDVGNWQTRIGSFKFPSCTPAALMTTTSLASGQNPSTAGASVVLTASVTGAAPSGNVAFFDGGVAIVGCGAVALSSSGSPRTAQCTTTFAAGTHSLTANYAGSGTYAPSPSLILSQVVTVATSTVSLATSAWPSTAGSPVTFTATVSGYLPAGTFTFKSDGVTIAGCSAVALTGSGNIRPAACTTSALTAGFHAIVANFSGDANNTASSAGLTQAVNAADAWLGFLLGSNVATGSGSAVAAGKFNSATNTNAAVFAGLSNVASGISSLVIGGFDNRATAIDSLVGAGAGHRATGARSVIVGGGYNLASGQWSFIGGGGRDGAGSTAAGTDPKDNIASGGFSVVAGGQGNLASGAFATVPGGAGNVASGSTSFAAGNRAKTQTAGGSPVIHSGAFVFADGSAFDFNSAASNEFAVRATGGVRFVSAISGAGAPTAGVSLAAGSGSWSSLSDRAAKRDLTPADATMVLAKVAAMPIYTWRYRSEASGALHMGPVAQDFHAAFGLGPDDRTITTVDADGVALAALQGLQQVVVEQDAVLAARAKRLQQLRERLAVLESRQRELDLLRDVVLRYLGETSIPFITNPVRGGPTQRSLP